MQAFGQSKHIDRANNACFRRLDRIMLVVYGRGRAGKIVYFIYLHIEWKCDVVAHQFKASDPDKRVDIAPHSGKEIVDAEDFAILAQESRADMRSKKSRATGHQDALSHFVLLNSVGHTPVRDRAILSVSLFISLSYDEFG